MSKTAELIHRPLGDRHPYENAADERVPRHPRSHDTVEIRVLTRPIGAIQKAQVAYWDTDHPEQVRRKELTFLESVAKEGAFTEDGHLSEAAARAGLVVGVDRWQAKLPPFPAGTKVCYQITAVTENQSLTSPIYAYTVRKLVPLHEIVGIYQGANSVTIVLQNAEAGGDGYLHLRVAGESHVQVEAGHGNCPQLEKNKLIQLEDAVSTLRFGTVGVQVEANPFNLQLFYQDKLLFSGMKAPQLIIGDDEMAEAIIFSFDSPQDEAFYGFGERFNALNQRDQRLDVRVYEQYKNHGRRTYLPMPLLISSRGYGLLVNSLRYSVFDLAHDDPERWTLQTELGAETQITLDILLGDDTQLLDLVARLNALTGRPVLPPNWAFGLWMSSNEWNSQARVEEIMRQNEQHKIPTSVIVLEAWSDENSFYIWNDAQYEPKPGCECFQYADFDFLSDGLWPDPKGMIENLHQQGLRVLLWQIPVLKMNEDSHAQLANDREYMLEQGYCVRREDGEAYEIRPFWFQNGLLMDFTHPQGVEWWMQKRKYLLTELGIDGFKTDGGEHIWGRDLLFADGRGSDETWNEYPNLYAGAYFNFARKHKPDAITFSRAGYTGAQSFPCHWAGDENSTWEAFRHSILAGLNAGISGVPFWGWDFAGFSGEIPTAELYLRATAMATFCPIMQYHSEYNHHRRPSNDRTPWNIQERTGDTDVIPTFRFFANLRMNLLPYIISEAWLSSQTGIPMMRALSLAFPTDAQCHQFPYQYLFGSALLVAPVVEEGVSQWPVYLPAGDWYDFWMGEDYAGDQTLDYTVPKERIPVFVRGGTILPLNLDDSFALGGDVGNIVDQCHNLCFRIYPDQAGFVEV
ncbi:TIM-barrel domain-containing protein [Candidatus Leptofilum sp.]|uniref:glycoside hydrolase family 31 protein n=1 Tax=Candidatus Leptofilum sp. TaxID=3241576 RepID=UPI003B594E48